MRRSVPTDPLLVPQPKAREKLSTTGEQHAKKKGASFTYAYRSTTCIRLTPPSRTPPAAPWYEVVSAKQRLVENDPLPHEV